MVLVDACDVKGGPYLLDVIMQITATMYATALLFSPVTSSKAFTDYIIYSSQ